MWFTAHVEIGTDKPRAPCSSRISSSYHGCSGENEHKIRILDSGSVDLCILKRALHKLFWPFLSLGRDVEQRSSLILEPACLWDGWVLLCLFCSSFQQLPCVRGENNLHFPSSQITVYSLTWAASCLWLNFSHTVLSVRSAMSWCRLFQFLHFLWTGVSVRSWMWMFSAWVIWCRCLGNGSWHCVTCGPWLVQPSAIPAGRGQTLLLSSRTLPRTSCPKGFVAGRIVTWSTSPSQLYISTGRREEKGSFSCIYRCSYGMCVYQ